MLDFVLGTNAASLEVNQSIVSGQTIWEKEISEKGYALIIFAGMGYGIFLKVKG